MEELYPKHFQALRNAGLVNKKPPSLKEHTLKMEHDKEDQPSQAIKRRRAKDRKRTIYFVVGHSPHWPRPIHKIIGDIRDKFPSLSWMRISISYRRFRNLRELLQGDLTTKLNERLYTKDLEDLPCKCKTR